MMFLAVVDQRNSPAPQTSAAFRDLHLFCLELVRCDHSNVVRRLPISVMNLEPWPGSRDARLNQQCFTFELYPQQGFAQQAVHPTRGAGIPRPATPSNMGNNRIDI